jgi:O-antigen ligase
MLPEERPGQRPFQYRPPFQPASSLDAVPRRRLLLVAIWMAVAYAVWIFLSQAPREHGYWELLPVIVGFAPLFLWALYDYRFGLLLAVMAAPLLNAPIIPHGFTQGFGDLFAACSIIGYLLRHPNPSQWRELWRPEYVWLGLILAAAAVSLIFTPVWGLQVPYGIKYGLAEIAGYSLAMAFLVILVHEVRSQNDFNTTLCAVAAAMLVVVLFSLVGLSLSITCTVSNDVQTLLTTNGAITSTFSNPNYHAAYLICVLPLALWFYLNVLRGTWKRHLAFAGVILLILLVQLSFSRAGWIGLVILWLGWLAITRWTKGTRMLSIVFGLMLPLTGMFWGYAIYACQPDIANMGIKDRLEFSRKQSKNITTSSGVRAQLALNAIKLWRENPVTGVGTALMSNFSFAGGSRNRAHNVLLTTLAEQGIVGASVWLGWLGCLAMAVWRARRRVSERGSQLAFLALALTGVVTTSMFMDSLRVISLWQLGALILAWSVIPHKESHVPDDTKQIQM